MEQPREGAGMFPRIISKLSPDEPRTTKAILAGVAVVLKDEKEPRALLIKRAERVGDPWSGQVAFPGGKSQTSDANTKETAERETKEEVGLDLRTGGRFLGYFGAFRTHTGTIDVVPSVFILRRDAQLKPTPEVSAFKWADLGTLLTEKANATFSLGMPDGTRELPAYRVDDFVVWGLTHRILSSLIGG